MLTKAVLCDICRQHIPDIKKGSVLFLMQPGAVVAERKIDCATTHDVACCADCMPGVIGVLEKWARDRLAEKETRSA